MHFGTNTAICLYDVLVFDTALPARFGDDPELGAWVQVQRDQLNKGTMDRRRAEKLASINFIASPFDEAWNGMYDQLVDCKQTYGHTSVMYGDPDYKSLGEWVVRQRNNAKGVCGVAKLSNERKNKLNALGFVWDKREDKWYRSFDRLVEYKQEHGDTNVPDKYELDQKLANWVKVQRARVRGTKPGGLKPERKALLDELNFTWNPSYCR